MAQLSMSGISTDIKDLVPGDEVQVDINLVADKSKARKNLNAMSSYTCALIAIDLAVCYKWCHPLKHQDNLK